MGAPSDADLDVIEGALRGLGVAEARAPRTDVITVDLVGGEPVDVR